MYRRLFVSAILVGLTYALAHADSARIQNPVNGNWYQRFDSGLSWNDAADDCESRGAHLVTLGSAHEDQFVFDNFGGGWLGGTDAGTEGTWRWVTGEPWDYENWGPGEPNNCCPPEFCGGTGCTPEHYLVYFGPPDLLWNDVPDSESSHICEWEEAPFLTVTFEDGSTTWPAGTGWMGFVSQTDDPHGPFWPTPESVHFRGTDVGGEFLVYRYRLEFAESVRIESVVLEGAAWNGSSIRLLDATNSELDSTPATAGNVFATVSLHPPAHVGQTFFLEETDMSSHWRYRSSIHVNAWPALLTSDPDTFNARASTLGALRTIDFEALPDGTPLWDRDPISANEFEELGVRFEAPGQSLQICGPGSWSSSNTLSPGRCPFDPGGNNDDDLIVRFDPPVLAAALDFVDNSGGSNESITFLDDTGAVIAGFDYLPALFVGLVAYGPPIAEIRIDEATDGDDVTYDNIRFVQLRIIDTIVGNFDPKGAHATEVGAGFPSGIASDTSGNVFVNTEYEVLRIDSSGSAFLKAGTGNTFSYSGDGGPAVDASFYVPWGLAAHHGDLFIADTGNHRVRKVDTSGNVTTVAGTGVGGFGGDGGPATSALLNEPNGLAVDGAGNLFITDTANQRIRKVDSGGTITTVAGTGNWGFWGDGGPATNAWLATPLDVAVDSAGALYIADIENARIRKVNPAGVITTLAGTGYCGYLGDGGPATAADVCYPASVAVIGDPGEREVYIADTYHYRVRRVGDDGIIHTHAGTGIPGYGGDGGPAVDADIGEVWAIHVDDVGNVYIGEADNYRVRTIDTGGVIHTVAGNGTLRFYGEETPAIDASLLAPRGIDLDDAGNLYIADSANEMIRMVDPSGEITVLAGTGQRGYSGDGGPATSASLNRPRGLVVDTGGNLFFADTWNHVVRMVDSFGTITTFAGTGVEGFGGDDGPATSAQLNGPFDVEVDGAGNVFIADRYNHRVRRVDGSGVIATVVGTGVAGFDGDGGPAASAQLNEPVGLHLDQDGNLFIADANHRVRKVSGGTIDTVAGTGNAGYNGDGMPATSADLFGPIAMATDSAGNLYIAEYEGSRLRMVGTDGLIRTVAGTGASGFGGDQGPAPAALLAEARDVLVGDDGNLYLADQNNNRIRIIRMPDLIETPEIPLPEVSESAPGLATAARTGFSTAGLGDLDGDGLADFITGAPSYTDESGDRVAGAEEAGAAVIYLGSTDEDERAFADIVFLGEAAHDRAGVAVAGGFDFNGDTVNDFMIGAEQVDRTDPDNPVLVGAGKAYLIYFDPTDTDHYPNINDPTMTDYVSLSLVGQPGGIPGVVFTGETLGDQAGFALAGGGVVDPGSGHDIAIGAPGHDTSGGQDAGAVYALFDDPTLTGTVSLADVPDTVDGVVYEGHAEGDALGFSVAFPGDVVVPAGEDIIMGAPLADVDTGADLIHIDAGIAYLGSAGTLSKGIIEVGEIGTEQDGAQVRGDQAGEQLGYSVAGGGDNLVNGEPDTLIGAPFYDNDTGPGDASIESAGRVAQLGGRLEKGIIEVGEIGTETDFGVAGAIYIGEGEGDRLGYSVAGLGDVTGDGTDDIGLGAPYADPGGLEDAGTIYIVEGYDDGTTEPDRGIIEVGEIGTSVAGRQVNGDEAGELAGFSMAETGDIDGDGSDDFVAGSPGTDEGEEEDTGSVSMVLESENLVVTPENQPPVADASATVTSWECEGELQAMVLLDGSASSDPDSTPGTADDIVSYDWWENGTSLGSGVQVSHSFALGSHPVTLEVRDQLGVSDADGITVAVADSGLPQGGITTPPAGTCFGPTELPVTVTDSYTDVCDPSLTRTYDPGPGPSYTAHGDYSVTLTVNDNGGNQVTDSVGFTIDTVPPTVEWLGLPDRISVRPFNLIFDANDDDDAAGDVVREVMKLDGCVIYDGATFGPDPDGLLSDDVLRFSPSELCRIREECGFDVLTGPELRVEATDCGGNVGHDAKVMTGRLILSNLPCAEPEAEPEEETRKESFRTPKRRML